MYRHHRGLQSRLKHRPRFDPPRFFYSWKFRVVDICGTVVFTAVVVGATIQELRSQARVLRTKLQKYVSVEPPIVTSPENVSEAMERTQQELISIWFWRDYARR